MARTDPTRDALAAITALDPQSPELIPALRRYLGRKSGPIVAAAARKVGALKVEALRSELEPAFARLCESPVKRDPGCRGKLAILEALAALDDFNAEVYLQAARLRQPEPSWGPPVDTAAGLRGQALLALAALSHPETPLLIAEALCDPEHRTRLGAAQALVSWNDPTLGLALLRVALGKGEAEPEVVEELFTAAVELGGLAWALEHLEGRAYVPKGSEGLYAEAAALALGASRDPEVFLPLKRWTELAMRPERRRVGLVALSLLRDRRAADYLLELVEEGRGEDREAALRALEVYRGDPAVHARLEALGL